MRRSEKEFKFIAASTANDYIDNLTQLLKGEFEKIRNACNSAFQSAKSSIK
jgi:hypothetical protein